MILEKGECIITNGDIQSADVVRILDEHGYRFHHGVSLLTTNSKSGFRYWHGGEYPNCIASLNVTMACEVQRSGYVDRDTDEGAYDVITYEDFVSRLTHPQCKVEVADLL